MLMGRRRARVLEARGQVGRQAGGQWARGQEAGGQVVMQASGQRAGGQAGAGRRAGRLHVAHPSLYLCTINGVEKWFI